MWFTSIVWINNKEAKNVKQSRDKYVKDHTGPPFEFLFVASRVAASAACKTREKALKAVCAKKKCKEKIENEITDQAELRKQENNIRHKKGTTVNS